MSYAAEHCGVAFWCQLMVMSFWDSVSKALVGEGNIITKTLIKLLHSTLAECLMDEKLVKEIMTLSLSKNTVTWQTV